MTAKRRTPASHAAEEAFRARVAELGGTVLEDSWLGAAKGHRVRCPEGHESTPQPQYLARGGGICSICGYGSRAPKRAQRSLDTEAAFRARVTELGGTVLEDSWLGHQKPHRVRCAKGHECAPRPNNVTQGSGFCLVCTWTGQGVVYVVAGPALVTFGVTSGDPKPRLRTHVSDGFSTELRVWRGLPSDVAFRSEQLTLARLKSAGVQPVRGREYYQGRYAPLIVDYLAALLHPHL